MPFCWASFAFSNSVLAWAAFWWASAAVRGRLQPSSFWSSQSSLASATLTPRRPLPCPAWPVVAVLVARRDRRFLLGRGLLDLQVGLLLLVLRDVAVAIQRVQAGLRRAQLAVGDLDLVLRVEHTLLLARRDVVERRIVDLVLHPAAAAGARDAGDRDYSGAQDQPERFFHDDHRVPRPRIASRPMTARSLPLAFDCPAQ